MTRRIQVIGIRKAEPDIRLYVLALIALARQLQAEATVKTDGRDEATSVEPEEADHA